MKYLIELSIKYESVPLFIAALLLLLASIGYGAMKQKGYQARYPLLGWLVIILPLIVSTIAASKIKTLLPAYQLVVSEDVCEKLMLGSNGCSVNVSLLSQNENQFVVRLKDETLHLDTCEVVSLTKRHFKTYKTEFDVLYESNSLLELIL